jgi:hypothetical protein
MSDINDRYAADDPDAISNSGDKAMVTVKARSIQQLPVIPINRFDIATSAQNILRIVGDDHRVDGDRSDDVSAPSTGSRALAAMSMLDIE